MNFNVDPDLIKDVLIKAANKIGMPYYDGGEDLIFNFSNKTKQKYLNKEYLEAAEDDDVYNRRKASLKREDHFIIVASMAYIHSKKAFTFDLNNGWTDLDFRKGKFDYMMNALKSKDMFKDYNDYLDWPRINKFVKAVTEVLKGDESTIYPLAIRKLAKEYNLTLEDYGKNKVKAVFKGEGEHIKFLKDLVKNEKFKVDAGGNSVSKGKLIAKAFTDTEKNESFVSIEY